MAGHNKWSQIKRKKAATDQKRASQWTKIIREITVAAREGGGDPGGNPRLRLAIDNARAVNMPNDNIDRAIKKGTGDLEGVSYEEVAYEAYGPGGVAIYIDGLTDNLNRTVADIRHVLSKNGGTPGQTGSAAPVRVSAGPSATAREAALPPAPHAAVTMPSTAATRARRRDCRLLTTTVRSPLDFGRAPSAMCRGGEQVQRGATGGQTGAPLPAPLADVLFPSQDPCAPSPPPSFAPLRCWPRFCTRWGVPLPAALPSPCPRPRARRSRPRVAGGPRPPWPR